MDLSLAEICCAFWFKQTSIRDKIKNTMNRYMIINKLLAYWRWAFSVFGLSTWNDLPFPHRQKPCFDSFKSNKIFLFQKLPMINERATTITEHNTNLLYKHSDGRLSSFLYLSVVAVHVPVQKHCLSLRCLKRVQMHENNQKTSLTADMDLVVSVQTFEAETQRRAALSQNPNNLQNTT